MYGSAVDSVLSEQTFGSGGATSAKWQLTDHLGSVRGVAQKQAGGSTSSINQVQYDAYGRITSQTNVGNQPRFGFAGRDIESVGGMTYNRNRYYSTSSGRFISQDPISFNAGDENLYRYVGNSPTNFTDPSGLHYRVVLAPAIPSLPQGPNNPLKEWREDDLDVWWKQQNAQSNSSAPTPSGPSMRAKTPEEILESHYDIYSELMQHQHSLDVILEATGIDLTQQRREIERLIARDAPEFLDSYHRGRLGLHSERVANSLLLSMNSRITLPSPQTRPSIVPNPTFGLAPSSGGNAVIGRMDNLATLRAGEHTLLDKLTPNLGSAKANWMRNSSVLREEMRKGIRIRDASAHLPDSHVLPDGRTVRDTFLGMERNVLRNKGWTFDGEFWNSPCP
jgi:RHS repeat-associated protein